MTDIRAWLGNGGVAVLNVAGPRDREATGICEETCSALRSVLSRNDVDKL